MGFFFGSFFVVGEFGFVFCLNIVLNFVKLCVLFVLKVIESIGFG